MENMQQSLETTLEDIQQHIDEQNIYRLVTIECGKEYPKIGVPVKGTTTDDWLVFGVNLTISADIEDHAPYDNAIFSFATNINPNKDGDSWSMGYEVMSNYNTNERADRHTLRRCGPGLPPLEIIAIKANKKIKK